VKSCRPLYVLIVLAASLAAAPVPAGAVRIRRVIDGVPASGSQWPFVAALVQRGAPAFDGQFCGGSVIAPSVVVTAAHCVEGSGAGDIEVVTGRMRLSDENAGQRTAVRAIRVDPKYDAGSDHHDAALLLLAQPTTAPSVALAGSTDRRLIAPGAALAVAGWGLVDNSGDSPDDLRTGSIQALAISDCSDAYGSDVVASLMVCAGSPPGGKPDSCAGDSGGPLVSHASGATQLVGLVAFGGSVCGDPSAPGVYTRVSAEVPWILQTLGVTPSPPTRQPFVRTQLGNISCGQVLCSVDVLVSGDVGAIGRIVVTVTRGGASPLRRSGVAMRRSPHVWRVRIDLPFGKLLITAQPFNNGGVAFGQAGSEGVQVTAG
jgi:secreted trypsin-like serine protease